MLPEKHEAPKIIMAVDYCGRHIPGGLGEKLLPTLKMKMQSIILDGADVACKMVAEFIGVLRCRFGCGIYVV